MQQVGVVAIGRNEGPRLEQCLQSIVSQRVPVVYVDSGSIDNSVELARSLNVEVVELDMSVPFTAARARNAGWERLLQVWSQVKYIQFVDGDCEVLENWLETAVQAIDAQPKVAIVCGRRLERYRDRSLYNRLCDMEWHILLNHTDICGGDALIRVEALRQVNGFNPSLIAGEEPELCLRMQQQGWQLLSIQAPMTLHDAQMLHFHQWWRRMLRAGHAYAEGAWLHRQDPERYWLKDTLSIWFWGLFLPLLALTSSLVTQGYSLLLLLFYPALAIRISNWMRKQDFSWQEALLYGGFCVLGKFPNVLGQVKFYWDHSLNKPKRLIEYK